MQALTVNFGLLATPDMVWHIAMDRMPESERAYIIAMLRRGERFNGEARITVSTIHGAKGGEADNVVLFTDLSPAAEAQMNINPDDTHRVFYVGVTRAKQSLFIVEPQDFTRSYDL
jgi:superfamily I DNA/RNA helicase